MVCSVANRRASHAVAAGLLAGANAALVAGVSWRGDVYDGWSVARLSALESSLIADGWQVKKSNLVRNSEKELYCEKGKARLYGMYSEFLGSFVSVEVAA